MQSKLLNALKKLFYIGSVTLIFATCIPKEHTVSNTHLYSDSIVNVRVMSPEIANVVPPGKENQFYVQVLNMHGITQQIEAEIAITSFQGSEYTFLNSFKLKPQESYKITFPDTVFSNLGIKWVKLKLKSKDINHTINFSFAYMDPVGNDYKSDFKFGVAGIRYTDKEELEWLYKSAALVGIQYERKYASWGQIQPDSTTWNWDKLDEELRIMESYGIERQLLLNGTVGWAANSKYADRKNKGSVPPAIAPWRRYVSEITKRYNGRINYIEIWNEPDIGFFAGTTSEYLEMLKAAHEEIKAVNPAIKVLSGGFAQGAPRQNYFIKRGDLHKDAVRLGQDYFDIHAFHRHGPFEIFKYNVDGPLKEIRDQLQSPRPLWFNETAMHSTFIGEKEQAKILFQKLSFSMARDAMGYSWFSLKNNTRHPVTSHEHNYGMITGNNSPKAVYVVYNELVKHLKDKHFVKEPVLGKGFEAFMYASDNDYLINTWKQDASIPDQLAVFRINEGCKVIVSDLMGNQKEYSVQNNKVIVPIHKDGSFINFLNCPEAPQVETPLFALYQPIIADENLNIEIPLNLREKLTVNPVLKVIDHAEVKQTKEKIILNTEKSLITLQLLDPDAGIDESLEVPVTKPLIINYTNTENYQINLAEYSNVVNNYEHDPNTQHLTWNGKEDLSVKNRISIENENLVLRFIVTDDAHHQTKTGHSQYGGDGIQLAFKTQEMLGFWEIGFARTNSGASDVYIWSSPAGYSANVIKSITLETERRITETTYKAEIPLKLFGLNNLHSSGFYYTFIVNDNDGEKREGWIQYTEGLGGGKDPNKFKYVVFK